MVQVVKDSKPEAEVKTNAALESQTFSSNLRELALQERETLKPSSKVGAEETNRMQIKGGGGGFQEYVHNHSALNQIITKNNSGVDFFIVMDYTSNGPNASKHKEVVRLTNGGETLESGDTDVILPRDRDTRFVLPGGEISPPGSAIRTSGKGEVTITRIDDNTFNIGFKKGLTPGSVSVIQNPEDDPTSHFRGADGMEAWMRRF